jgi:hypothetical protein
MAWWFLPLLLGGLIGGATGFITSLIIGELTDDNVKENIRIKVPDAFKAILKDKNTKRVHFDVFNQDSKLITDLEIKSEKEVNLSLKVGDEIYLN